MDQIVFVGLDGRCVGNINLTEAGHVAEVVAAYEAAGIDADDISVIALLRVQATEIFRRTDVTIDMVDRFQGSLKEVIVVSFIATGELDDPLSENYRRINVALTQAKKALCLIGDADALESDLFYNRILTWARR